jgi:hypothetical protein
MVFGPAGLYVRLLSECWSEKQDCSGYFPLGIGISNLMSWPIFVTERLAFGEHGFVSRYDTAIARYWWILLPALWLYDYTVFAAAKVLVGFIRSVGRRQKRIPLCFRTSRSVRFSQGHRCARRLRRVRYAGCFNGDGLCGGNRRRSGV